MSAEEGLRERLAEIDELRAKAATAEKMLGRWMGHDGELVADVPVVVRRRWRSDHTLHSEVVLDRDDRDLFLGFLEEYRKRCLFDARALSEKLGVPQ